MGAVCSAMTDLPRLPTLAALLRINLDDPDDADDAAALRDLLVRRELRALRDHIPPPPSCVYETGGPAGTIDALP